MLWRDANEVAAPGVHVQLHIAHGAAVTLGGGGSPGGLGLSDVDALEDAEARRHADEGRSAVGHEWQRDAGDGHDPEDHPDIDDELEEDHRCDAGGEQRAKRVA